MTNLRRGLSLEVSEETEYEICKIEYEVSEETSTREVSEETEMRP